MQGLIKELTVIVVSDLWNWNSAKQAKKIGAFDYIAIKLPMAKYALQASETDRVLAHVKFILAGCEESPLTISFYRKEFERFGLAGADEYSLNLCSQIFHASQNDNNILIIGDDKEKGLAVAKTIHNLSLRRINRFQQFNCTGINNAQAECAIFGSTFSNEKAERNQTGLINMISGGTLFLEDIDKLPGVFQSKLYRALHEGNFYQAGGIEPIKADFRLISYSPVPLLSKDT